MATILASFARGGLVTRHVPGVFHSRSNPAPNVFQDGQNEIEIARFQGSETWWSGERDSNSRSPGPKPGALPS